MNDNKYKSKAKQSFQTKLDIFLFDLALKKRLTDRFDDEQFKTFVIDKDIVKEYTSAWQIRYKDSHGEDIREIDRLINEYYNNGKHDDQINELQKDYVDSVFPTLFPREDFQQLLERKKCHYCGITEEQLNHLIVKKEIYKKQPTRGWSFEIDRKYPNEEYYKDNCVLCCYWCNNAKTDEFCEREFRIIGDAIKRVWESRLNK